MTGAGRDTARAEIQSALGDFLSASAGDVSVVRSVIASFNEELAEAFEEELPSIQLRIRGVSGQISRALQAARTPQAEVHILCGLVEMAELCPDVPALITGYRASVGGAAPFGGESFVAPWGRIETSNTLSQIADAALEYATGVRERVAVTLSREAEDVLEMPEAPLPDSIRRIA